MNDEHTGHIGIVWSTAKLLLTKQRFMHPSNRKIYEREQEKQLGVLFNDFFTTCI